MLIAGLLLVALELLDWVRDGWFFLGIALVVTALAWFISELRHVRRIGRALAVCFLLAGAVAFVIAALVPGGRPLAIFVGLGLLLAELGTEVLSEATSDHRHATKGADKSARPGAGTGAHTFTAKSGHASLHVSAEARTSTDASVNESPDASADPDCCRRLGHAIFITVVGASLVVVGALCFRVGFEMHADHLLVLLAIVGVLMAMASADNDSLVLVGLVGIALLWATAPRDVEPPDVVNVTAGDEYFLALGDSYISGEGATRYIHGTNTKDGENDPDHIKECRRAPTAWPVTLAESPPPNVPSRVMVQTCSGAVTENIDMRPRPSKDGNQRGPAELALFERDRESLADGAYPEFVVVSVGGNDAGFGLVGKTCVGPGSCAEIAEQFIDDGPPGPGPEPVPDKEEDLASINDDLDDAYDNIEESLDGASERVPVVVVPYPIPLAATTGPCRDLLLDEDEREFVRQFVRELNQMIEAAAARHGFLYMDTMQGALNDRKSSLCEDVRAEAGLNFLALSPTGGDQRQALLPTNWVHNSFHPTAEGHAAMRAAAARWFDDHDDLEGEAAEAAAAAEAAEENGTVRIVEPTLTSTYDDENPPAQCDPDEHDDCELDGWRWSHTQATLDYRIGIIPVLVLAGGMWLVLGVPRRYLQRHDITIVSLRTKIPKLLQDVRDWIKADWDDAPQR